MSYSELVKFQERIEATIDEKGLSGTSAAKDQLREASEKAGCHFGRAVRQARRLAGIF
jgi:hypothetical protein